MHCTYFKHSEANQFKWSEVSKDIHNFWDLRLSLWWRDQLVFYTVTLQSLVGSNQCFQGKYCIHLQPFNSEDEGIQPYKILVTTHKTTVNKLPVILFLGWKLTGPTFWPEILCRRHSHIANDKVTQPTFTWMSSSVSCSTSSTPTIQCKQNGRL
jgi:hypothetical protein